MPTIAFVAVGVFTGLVFCCIDVIVQGIRADRTERYLRRLKKLRRICSKLRPLRWRLD